MRAEIFKTAVIIALLIVTVLIGCHDFFVQVENAKFKANYDSATWLVQKLESQNMELLQNYRRLLSSHELLLEEFKTLNQSYVTLSQSYTALTEQYQKVLADYVRLTLDYASLNLTYWKLFKITRILSGKHLS